MAKKINEVLNGDLKMNVVVLRSVFGKVGLKYFIQPHKDAYGRWPECVKRVDAHGDKVLTPEELKKEAEGLIYYVPETQVFELTDGTTYNLDDVHERCIWEAIKNSDLIAPDRLAKNKDGVYIIDGGWDAKTKMPRSGKAELYVYHPGAEAEAKVTKKKLILEACNYIFNDERGYEGRLNVAKVLGRDMKNQPNADVEDYLISIAERTPEKIINCYTGGDLQLRMLFIEAREKGVIKKNSGVFVYGEVILGATETAVIDWMKSSRNNKTLALIRQDTYPDMFEDDVK